MPEPATASDKLKGKNVTFSDLHPRVADKRTEILSGLQKKQKSIDPKYFYDKRGSELFEQITGLPEYYPTRTERQILTREAKAMAKFCGQNCVLIEPGSGSSEKVRLLLDSLKPSAYVPLDISAEFLRRSAEQLAAEYPWLNIHAICTDFTNQEEAPAGLPAGKRVVFYPGSTLGNMKPAEASDFLRNLGRWLNQDGGALIGIDMHKSTRILEAAYNDQQGITALFNLNILSNINALMDANFDINRFSHRSFYNEEKYRIEMHLVSNVDQEVKLGETILRFARGETIHTENSYKYTLESFQQIASNAGFAIRSSWSDEQQLFSVHYLELD
ncbi:MAG: L-histidine N(alpha)-methyltransferase [Lysobacterales bacterium]